MKSVAVIGMACRLPGGLDSVSDLWSALVNKVNTAGKVPADRWDADRYFAEEGNAPGKGYVRRGNFLKQDVRSFDGAFFDLPPSVSENLDPQQRLMLEVVWEAFENAGIDLPAHAGSNIGVYTGGFMLDHMITQMSFSNRSIINQNTAAGMMMTMLSNRISHAFDLHGPSLSIDTACSSSLTAFNYGFQDVRNGLAEMAIVGGVNVMTRPEYPVGMCKGHFLARDGECKSFDARGDGYGRGEGAGVVILKDYDKAVADGDEILAKVIGAGVNSDGRTPGISMPSGEAQQKLIEDVCRDYEIVPSTIDYVECHGTGTAVGDPIEASSVGTAFGVDRKADNPLVIGSIKSNIGHTEATAGVAGVIKAVLTLQHRLATPLANLKEPHPDIPFDALNVRLPVEAIPLGASKDAIRVAVNSFGYGGTNAHAIFEEVSAPKAAKKSKTDRIDFPRMLPISARSPKALAAMAGEFAALLKKTDDAGLDDILYSASHRRAHLSNRAVVVGEDKKALHKALVALSEGSVDDGVVTGDAAFGAKDAPVFVYTGMGPQWWAMGQELYRENPIFKAALDEADAAFKKVSGFSILEQMLKDEASSEITKTEYAQPGNFMVQYGLSKVLDAAGVQPGAIVGHSVGEVASACAAGALSLEDAVTVSFHRSQAQAKTAGTGSMLAVGLSVEKLQPYLEQFGSDIDIAATNGPNTVTVAGDTLSIRRLGDMLTADEAFNRELQVEVPYHSHLMSPITDEITESLASLKPSAPTQRLFSTVTGQEVTGIAYDAAYWARNVREQVSFMQAINALMDEGYTNFVEVGPHPVLRSALLECARGAGKEIRLTETLRRGEPETPRIHRAVAQVFANGAPIDWELHNPTSRFVDLPNYPWQREALYLETDRGVTERVADTLRPMLGNADLSAARVWRNDLDFEGMVYLREHVVGGAPVMPAAGYIETLFELGAEMLPEDSLIEVRNARIAAPLVITPGRGVDYTTLYDPDTGTTSIRSAEQGSIGAGQLHMSAQVSALEARDTEKRDMAKLMASCGEKSSVTELYSDLAGSGLEYGPLFQPITDLRINVETREAAAKLELRPELAETFDTYLMHPTLLDGCFQMLMGILQGDDTMYLPTGFKSIRLMGNASGKTIWCHGNVTSQTAKHLECDLTLFAEDGTVIATIQGMEATAGGAARKKTRVDKWGDPTRLITLQQEWNPAGMLSEPRRLGAWMILRDQTAQIADKVVANIEALGAVAHRVVTVGDAFADEGQFVTIRSGNEDDAAKLIEGAGKLDGILIAHGLDATADSDDPTAENAIATMIALSKAIAKLPVAQRPRIYVLTQNAFACDGGDRKIVPAQTAINGFVRVAHNELEGCGVSSVDLPKRIDDRIIDAAGQEILCDALEDEIALRGSRRMMSEMAETNALDQLIVEDVTLTDGAAVRARPAKSDSVDAMVELVSLPMHDVGANDMRVKLHTMSLPSSVLADTNQSTLDQPFINLVGEVVQSGAQVKDLSEGTVVFGYAPADFASHVQGARNKLHVVPLPEGIDHSIALDALSSGVIATYAVNASGLEAGDTVLVHLGDTTATAIADLFEARGLNVHRFGTEDAPATSANLDAMVAKTADGSGFDAIVAPMGQWMHQFGAASLASGGILIDTSDTAEPILTPEHASSIVRTDLAVVTGRPKLLNEALRQVSETLGDQEAMGGSLSIRMSDMVGRRLEIPPVELRIDVAFDLDRGEVPVAMDRELSFSDKGSYLVTGGLGGFGQRTSAWLVEKGARHLVLASRSGANSDDKRAFVAGLEAKGVTVDTPKIDLSDRDAVKKLVDEVHAASPLKGVFHSAAVIEDEDLENIDMASYRRVMQSKATSADAIDRATADIDLDWFVLYSSIANGVGNRRQAPYSAANSFLDGLAWARRAAGKPTIAINWGAIGGAGVLVDDEATEQFLKYIGIGPLDVEEALTLMQSAMEHNETQIGIMMLSSWADWARYETIGSQSPRMARLIESDLAAGQAGGSEVRERLIEELTSLDGGERFDVLTGLVKEVIAAELRVDAGSLSSDRPINELGVDSLMAAEIQMVLESNLAISITVMDMLGAATIRSVCDKAMADFGFIDSIAAE